MSGMTHIQEPRAMALKLGVACLHVGKSVIQALLGACFVAVAGAATLSASVSPIATAARLASATPSSGFVCAGPDPLDPLDT